jgi:hypothetical protein
VFKAVERAVHAEASVAELGCEAGRVAEHPVAEEAADEGNRLDVGRAEFVQGDWRRAGRGVKELELEGKAIGAPEGIFGDEADGAGFGGRELGEAARQSVGWLCVRLCGAGRGELANGGEVDLRPLDPGEGERRQQGEQSEADRLHARAARGVAEAGMSAPERKSCTRKRAGLGRAGLNLCRDNGFRRRVVLPEREAQVPA